jgi:dienelactone hydrolase
MQMSLVFATSVTLFLTTSVHGQVARQEVHPFQSVTLSDTDFLNGKKDGIAVTLAAYLRLPTIGPEKLPAVILLHGSGGLGGLGLPIEEWAKELNEIGVATFALDSFSGRGLVTVNTDQTLLGRFAMVMDAYRALGHLASHRQIDPKRIAVMGFSRGGTSALYSSMTRFQRLHGSAGAQFAAHVGMYGSCDIRLRNDDDIAKPVRLLRGLADDWSSVAACRDYVDRLSKAGKDIRLIEYPDAHHLFDSPFFRTPRKFPDAQVWSNCKIAEGNDGVVLNTETNAPFSYADSCVQKGATIAYNHDASTKSRAEVRAFFREIFALK